MSVTVDFSNLAADFDATTIDVSVDTTLTAGPTGVLYTNGAGDEITLFGSGFTFNMDDVLIGGIVGEEVTSDFAEIDLGNDDAFGEGDVIFNNLPSVSAADFLFESGTVTEIRNAFFGNILSGDDTFDLANAGDFTVRIDVAGDGVQSAATDFRGGDDLFTGGMNSFSDVVVLTGDLDNLLAGGRGVGGNDTFQSVGSFVRGDFIFVSAGANAVGGNDIIQPLTLVDNSISRINLEGDANTVFGSLIGGDDLLDASGADNTGFSGLLSLNGDAVSIVEGGLVAGGDDRILGSDNTTAASGDFATVSGFGQGGNDEILAGSGDDTLRGDAFTITSTGFLRGGNDRIFGGGGDDLIFGDEQINTDGGMVIGGNDILVGNQGDDTISGGGGNDRVQGDIGNDILNGDDGDDVLLGVFDNDQLRGGTGNDLLRGGEQDDLLLGGNGMDTLAGGTGRDTLGGGAGNDSLEGRGGFDTLDGGAGNDTLNGGSNADVFVFSGVFGNDVIEDFADTSNAEDIDLSGVSSITDFADLEQNHLSLVNGVATIDDGAGNTITLLGITTTANLDANDFIF